MEWTDIILFSLGGRPVLLVDLVSSLLGLTCVFLAGRNSKYNFWVGYLYTASLFFLFWNRSLYASLLLQPISLSINVMGHWRWTHPKESERSSEDGNKLKVSMLSWRQRGFTMAAILLVALVWGWVMKALFPTNPAPYLDCCVTVLILTAQLLSALKKWDCWVAWLLVNITQLILHIRVGNVFMPIVSALYLVNGLWSLASWWKLYKKNG
ncbi:MAG: nicotinamide mononucleotide transporter [Bacteroidales bacterium]|nr:nicotinamide mononucleotide transporter [Bacteroidales bacterium]